LAKQYVDKIEHFKGFVSPFLTFLNRLQLITYNSHPETRDSV